MKCSANSLEIKVWTKKSGNLWNENVLICKLQLLFSLNYSVSILYKKVIPQQLNEVSVSFNLRIHVIL